MFKIAKSQPPWNVWLPNCTMLYYVFSGPLSLRAYVPEIKFNNNNNKHIPSVSPRLT